MPDNEQLEIVVKNGRHAGPYPAVHTAACERRVFNDHALPAENKDSDDAFSASIRADGIAFDERMQEVISAANPNAYRQIVERNNSGKRTKAGKAQAERDTLYALLDPTVTVLFGDIRLGDITTTMLSKIRGAKVGAGQKFSPSQPDVLLVSPERDAYGLPCSIIPVDIKHHNALTGSSPKNVTAVTSTLVDPATIVEVPNSSGAVRQKDAIQLAAYYRHLQYLDLAEETARGAIIGVNENLTWMNLDLKRFTNPTGGTKLSAVELYDFHDVRWQRVVENAHACVATATVTPIVFPERKTACVSCAWKSVCDDDLTSFGNGGHITLLPGVTPKRAAVLYRFGYESIRDVARLDPRTALAVDAGADSDDIIDGDLATMEFCGTGIKTLTATIYAARVASAGRVARNVGVNELNLHRADVEIDFDLENSMSGVADPQDRTSRVYLWGARTTTRRVTKSGAMHVRHADKQFSDFKDTADGEAKAFARFWTWMVTSRQKALGAGKTWRAFHYTRHETSWFRKLANRHVGVAGVPTLEQVEELLETGDIVDLHAILTAQLVWPTQDHSVKTLAKWARFSWRASDAGGDSSLVWHTNAVTAGTKKVRDDNRRRVLEYNIDDVAAQVHVREWLDQLSSAENPGQRIPLVTALRGPLSPRRPVAARG